MDKDKKPSFMLIAYFDHDKDEQPVISGIGSIFYFHTKSMAVQVGKKIVTASNVKNAKLYDKATLLKEFTK